jgi:hypothetical protein
MLGLFHSRLFPLRWFISLTSVPLRWFISLTAVPAALVYLAHGYSAALVYLAHGYSVLRTGLRGRALTGGPQWPAAQSAVAGEMRQSGSVSLVLFRSRLFLGFASGLRGRAP